nr:hypothetical protein [Tanacetum cinerariifolium]
ELLNLRIFNQDPPVDLYYLEGSDEGDNEIDSLTKEPSDTFLMRDKVISTTLKMENDEFKKSSVDDLFPILKESEMTSVYDDLECDMPVDTPLPTTNVREGNFDINSPLGEYVDDFFLVKNLSLTKRMSDEPLDNEIDSLTKEPSDTLLMRDKVISTTLKMENDEFKKSSVDDLFPILKESEMTSVYDDLECDMPVDTPLPTTNVREGNFDINSPLGEYVDDFFLVKNLSLTKRMSDEPLDEGDGDPFFWFSSYAITLSYCIPTKGGDVSLLPSSPHIGIALDIEDSRAHGFVPHSLKLPSSASLCESNILILSTNAYL